MSSTHPMDHKQNLGVIKQHIDKKLGPPLSALYWDNFSKFLRSKISKQEWDHTLRVVLSNSNVSSGLASGGGGGGGGAPPRTLSIPQMSIAAKPPDIVILHNYLVKCLLFNIRHDVSGGGLAGDSARHMDGILKPQWKSWSTFTRSPFRPGMHLLNGKFQILSLPALERIRSEQAESSVGGASEASSTLAARRKNRNSLRQNAAGVNQVLSQAAQLSNPFTTQSTVVNGSATVQLNPRFMEQHFEKISHTAMEEELEGELGDIERPPKKQRKSILEDLTGVHEMQTVSKYGGLMMALADAQEHNDSIYEHPSVDRDKIQMRMRQIAGESGLLRGVHDESVNLVLRSMEWYLKDIISKCIELKKKNVSIMFPAATQQQQPLGEQYEQALIRKVTSGSYFTRNEQFSSSTHAVHHSYLHYKDDMEDLFEKRAAMEVDEEDDDDDEVKSDGEQDKNDSCNGTTTALLSSTVSTSASSGASCITARDMLAACEGSPAVFKNQQRLRQKLLLTDWDLS